MSLPQHKQATNNRLFKWDHYLDIYTDLFRDLESPTILEVGIFEGESLQLWASYLPDAKVIGLDCSPPEREFADNVTVYRGRQEDEGILATVAKEGPFDIIIDDASHSQELTWTTFRTLFPHLKSGGFYVIEDWAAFSQLDTVFSDTEEHISTESNVHLVRRLINELAIWMGNKYRSFADSKFTKLEFHENLLVIVKR